MMPGDSRHDPVRTLLCSIPDDENGQSVVEEICRQAELAIQEQTKSQELIRGRLVQAQSHTITLAVAAAGAFAAALALPTSMRWLAWPALMAAGSWTATAMLTFVFQRSVSWWPAGRSPRNLAAPDLPKAKLHVFRVNLAMALQRSIDGNNVILSTLQRRLATILWLMISPVPAALAIGAIAWWLSRHSAPGLIFGD
jgi:hypothetical protein